MIEEHKHCKNCNKILYLKSFKSKNSFANTRYCKECSINIDKYNKNLSAIKIRKITSLNGLDKDDYIQCKICGEYKKIIENNHLKKHNISVKDYMKKYGEIYSNNYKDVMSNMRKKQVERRKNNPWDHSYIHSEETKNKVRGEKNGNWRGGNAKGYRGSDWIKQRKICYERDNYTCQCCGFQNTYNIDKKKIIAHHIIPFRVSKDNSIGNLISLCINCHIRIESRYYKSLYLDNDDDYIDGFFKYMEENKNDILY